MLKLGKLIISKQLFVLVYFHSLCPPLALTDVTGAMLLCCWTAKVGTILYVSARSNKFINLALAYSFRIFNYITVIIIIFITCTLYRIIIGKLDWRGINIYVMLSNGILLKSYSKLDYS